MSFVDKKGVLTVPNKLADDIEGFQGGVLVYDRAVLLLNGELNCLTYTPAKQASSWFRFGSQGPDLGPAITPAKNKAKAFGYIGIPITSVHSNGTTHLVALAEFIAHWFVYDKTTGEFTKLCALQLPLCFDIGIVDDAFYLIECEKTATNSIFTGIRQILLADLPVTNSFAEAINLVEKVNIQFYTFGPRNRFDGKYIGGTDHAFIAQDYNGRCKCMKTGSTGDTKVYMDNSFNNGQVLDGAYTAALKFIATRDGDLCYYNGVGSGVQDGKNPMLDGALFLLTRRNRPLQRKWQRLHRRRLHLALKSTTDTAR